MSLSLRELEQKRVSAWNRRAKGHPMRWRILRDAVAVLSLSWMDTSEFQIVMRRLYALKKATARDLLEELEEEGAIKQERDEKNQIYKWGATRSGVSFWIVSTENIPATIAQVVGVSMNVGELEV